jgi:acyl-CoA reductase-like NAD-dependent aldehyde dehydrogenase
MTFRPISSAKGEIGGTLYRARHLIKVARDCLKPLPQTEFDTPDKKMVIVKQPIGVVVAITPWNYPHLCTVNTVIPALLSGNSVILKPAPQTPVPSERVLATFLAAGLPQNLLQVIHLSLDGTAKLVSDPRVDFVAFTGSVAGGRAVQEAAIKGPGFRTVNLELGGKDPAYVRQDADLKYTVENLVDGEHHWSLSQRYLFDD